MTQLRRLGEVISEEDPQLWLMLRMLFNCFIRPRELRFLKIGDIDFIAGRVKIRAEISKNKKDGVSHCLKSAWQPIRKWEIFSIH